MPARHPLRTLRLTLGWLALAALLPGCEHPQPRTTPTWHAAIASAHPLATQAGLDVLKAGGNAFDAAIAVASTLAVVEPYSAGMGGGGFWLLHSESEHRDVVVDAREVAPRSASRNMYLDASGTPLPEASVNGPRAAGIPGQPAAIAHIAERYGQLPLSASLARAIAIARDGFPVNRIYLDMVAQRREVLARYPASRTVFLADGAPLTEGSLIRQPDLANTLQAIAEQGRNGFYRGPVAERLLAGANAEGARWDARDLEDYEVIEREPLRLALRLPAADGSVSEATLVTTPPPSAGGIALAEMFNMLAHLPPANPDTAAGVHLMAEVMQRAYRDRALYLGDPAFATIPYSELLGDEHARQWARGIHADRVTRSGQLGRLLELRQGSHTTHLSVVDAHGNRVSATLSINLPFGSAFTAPGTGILLNNEMDDFSLKVGAPNSYGLVGSEANAIAPGKRPLSSMTPSFLEFTRNGQPHLAVIGTPGGSRIISMVFLGLEQALTGKPVQDWVGHPRFHHQYLPDEIQYEPDAFSADTHARLTALGHKLTPVGRRYGNMQAIDVNLATGEMDAASDPRGMGQAAGLGTHP